MSAQSSHTAQSSERERPPIVLLATEDEMVCGMLEPTFDKHGWTVITTDSGDDALALTRSATPDVTLIDGALRFCDAFAYMHAIDETDHAPAVVVLTDGAPDSEVVRAFDLGAGDVVDRPYHPQIVFSRARRLIDLRGGRS